jgi:hypothetical protein
MHPELKAYLDEFEAKAKARYDRRSALQDVVLSKLLAGVSTPQSTRPLVTAADGGLTDAASVPAVVPDIFIATNQAQEASAVAHDAPPVCIEMAPVTCSTECPTQVVAITSVDKVHDAATTVCPESLVDLNDKEVEQLTPALSTPLIGTGTSSITEEVVPSVAATPAVTPTATVHISLELTDSAVSAEPFDVDATDAAALTHTKCSRKGCMQV